MRQQVQHANTKHRARNKTQRKLKSTMPKFETRRTRATNERRESNRRAIHGELHRWRERAIRWNQLCDDERSFHKKVHGSRRIQRVPAA